MLKAPAHICVNCFCLYKCGVGLEDERLGHAMNSAADLCGISYAGLCDCMSSN